MYEQKLNSTYLLRRWLLNTEGTGKPEDVLNAFKTLLTAYNALGLFIPDNYRDTATILFHLVVKEGQNVRAVHLDALRELYNTKEGTEEVLVDGFPLEVDIFEDAEEHPGTGDRRLFYLEEAVQVLASSLRLFGIYLEALPLQRDENGVSVDSYPDQAVARYTSAIARRLGVDLIPLLGGIIERTTKGSEDGNTWGTAET